jgi:hypothetical protein
LRLLFKAEGEFNPFVFLAGAAAIAGFAILHNRLTRMEHDMAEQEELLTVTKDDVERLEVTVDTLAAGVRRGVAKLGEIQTELEQLKSKPAPTFRDLDPIITKAQEAGAELSAALPENQPEPEPPVEEPVDPEPVTEPEPNPAEEPDVDPDDAPAEEETGEEEPEE